MTSALPLLRVPDAPALFVLPCDGHAAQEARSGWAEAGLTVRVVRGRKMRTLPDLLDEFAAALQFPGYFGENKDAFEECLVDLSWLRPGSGYVLVIDEPGEVLQDAGDSELRWLVATLADTQEEWGRPVEQGEWWDRPAVPFHVVLHTEGSGAAPAVRRWSGAGARVVVFPGVADPRS